MPCRPGAAPSADHPARGGCRPGRRARRRGVGGWQVEAILPFAREEYEKDFATPKTVGTTGPACLAEFRDLLGRAAVVLELDGDGLADDQRARAYEAAGRAVVRNCDLLIAIWDGEKTGKTGGTSEVVRFAARSGPPIWWLRADGRSDACVLDDIADFRSLTPSQRCADAEAWLADYLRATLRPPADPPAHPHGDLERVLEAGRRLMRWPERDGLRALIDGRPPRERAPWQLHARVRDWAARGWAGRHDPEREALLSLRAEAGTAAPLAAGDLGQRGAGAEAWARAFRAPDAWANGYSARYRTTYLVVVMLIAFALAMAGLSLAWYGGKLPATVLELGALLALIALVAANLAGRWHQRWLSYRLIAELCRQQHHLAPLAWSLPLYRVDVAARAAEPGSEWVGWYFNALTRAAPLPKGRITPGRLGEVRAGIRDGLLLDQVRYHSIVRPRSLQVVGRLQKYGERLFSATLVAVAVKLGLLLAGAPAAATIAFGFLALLLPVLSTGFFAFRAYAEFNVLAAQSARMLDGFVEIDRSLTSVELTLPLASQELAGEAYELAAAMLADIEGWATLFRVKVVEAG
ncbi:MAG: hypothetical protein AB7O45_06900 [Alphaproteobacteria bacterium]